MSLFKVALLQIKPGKDQVQNLQKGLEWCKKAKDAGADLALFPEMWNNGYSLPDENLNHEQWKKTAITRKTDFFRKFQLFSKDNEISIAITYLEKSPNDQFKNTVSVIDKTGNIIMNYSKVHTCSFSDESVLTPGSGFEVCELDLGKDKVILGAMICYDREFPEAARVLMLKGAEIVLIPNACFMDINRKSQLRSRAFENMTGICLANYPDTHTGGRSLAFDGMAYTEATENQDGLSRDMLMVEAGFKEELLIAEFNLNQLRNYRSRENWGWKFRHPSRYQIITENQR